jgi:hypothetical protein
VIARLRTRVQCLLAAGFATIGQRRDQPHRRQDEGPLGGRRVPRERARRSRPADLATVRAPAVRRSRSAARGRRRLRFTPLRTPCAPRDWHRARPTAERDS